MEAYERDMLARALEAAGQNVKIAAARLGVSRKYLYDRFKALGVRPKRPGDAPPGETPTPTTLAEMFARAERPA